MLTSHGARHRSSAWTDASLH